MIFDSQKTQITWQCLTVSVLRYKKKKEIITNTCGRIGPSTMTALVGPSGAGKTTLMNAIAGRLPKEYKISGKVLVNGVPRDHETWPYCFGYVEQAFHSLENITVYEVILFSAQMRLKVPEIDSVIYDHVNNLIFILGLEEFRNSYIKTLSDGESKRVYIAVELASNPPILFLDEPVNNLDSANAIKIIELLKDLTRRGKTILMTIHQPSKEILELFDKIIIMVEGKEVCIGNVNEF